MGILFSIRCLGLCQHALHFFLNGPAQMRGLLADYDTPTGLIWEMWDKLLSVMSEAPVCNIRSVVRNNKLIALIPVRRDQSLSPKPRV